MALLFAFGVMNLLWVAGLSLLVLLEKIAPFERLVTAGCPAPRLFVGTGQVQRRIISWELARGARDNLTMGRA